MTLGKRNISLQVGGGLLQDNDKFLLEQPQALEVENVKFAKAGSLSKRNGEASIPDTAGLFLPFNRPRSLLEDQGGTVLLHDLGCFQYDTQVGTWSRTNQAAPRPSTVLTDPLIRTGNRCREPDIAVVGNLACVVWEDDDFEVAQYAFFDVRYPSSILSGPSLFVGATRRPRIMAVNGIFCVVAFDPTTGFNGATKGYRYDPAAENYTFSAATTLVTHAVASGDAFMCPDEVPSNFVLVFQDGAGTIFRQVSNALVLGLALSVGSFLALAATYNPIDNRIVAISNTGSIAHMLSNFLGAITVAAGVTLEPGATTAPTALRRITRGTICMRDYDGKMFAAWSGNGDAFSIDSGVDHLGTDIAEFEFVAGAPVITRQGFVPTLAIATDAFPLFNPLIPKLNADGPEEIIIGLVDQVRDSVATGGTLLAQAPRGYFARPIVTAAGAYSVADNGRFLIDKIRSDRNSHVIKANGTYHAVCTVVTVITSSVTEVRAQVDLVQAQFVDTLAVRDVTAQGIRLTANGSGVNVFDGLHYTELTPPPVVFMSDGGVDPLEVDVGSPVTPWPRYKALWRWVDSRGNRHRGACFDVDGTSRFPETSPVYARMIALPWPGVTAINGDRDRELDLEVYQLADDDQYHLINVVRPIQHPRFPSHAAFSLGPFAGSGRQHFAGLFAPNNPLLLSGEVLYTENGDPGELAALPPPPMSDLVSTQSRLWGLSSEDRLSVWPTKPITAGLAPEFSAELVVRIPAEGGDCVALGSLGDRIAVFKERQTYTIFGEPGASNGEGSTIQTPRLVATDVGCVNPRSVVEVLPLGVAFQSQKGLALLSPDNRVELIGTAARDALGSATVTASVLVPGEEEVRWYLDNDTVIVWHFRRNAWSTWSGVEAVDACVIGDRTVRLLDTSEAIQETPGSWAAGSTHEVAVTTPWIKLAGVQGLQRVSRATFLLRWYSGRVRIETGYDYEPGFVGADAAPDVAVWLPSQLTALAASDGRVQLSIDVLHPKCESIRFRISEDNDPIPSTPPPTPPAVDPPLSGRGFELIGIDLMAGVKRGGYRHKQADGGKG